MSDRLAGALIIAAFFALIGGMVLVGLSSVSKHRVELDNGCFVEEVVNYNIIADDVTTATTYCPKES